MDLRTAVQHHQSGNLAEAEAIYRRILQLDPLNPDALHLLGVAAFQRGDAPTAVEFLSKAITTSPASAEFHCNLGLVLRSQGQLSAAKVELNHALELNSEYPEAYHNLGVVFDDQGDYRSAAISHQRAIQLRPDYAEAYSHLGFALEKLGQLDDSVAVFQQLLKFQPNDSQGHYNLGLLFEKLGRTEAAIQSLQKAVQLCPKHAEAYFRLGHVFLFDGQQQPGIAALQSAIQLRPDYSEAYCILGNVHQLRGEHEIAIEYHRRAFRLNPRSAKTAVAFAHQLQHGCLWSELDELTKQAIQNVERSIITGEIDLASPFSFLTLSIPTTLSQQFGCARKWIRAKCATPETILRPVSSISPPFRNRKLTLGYLSADFHGHATAWLIAELLEVHARDRFRVYCYSFGPDSDDSVRQRIIHGVDMFRDVRGLGFRETANQIAADDVDILIDLKGFTGLARTQILAYRPAPIQVNYLGYPGTMGADFIDYIVVDDFIAPSEHQPFYSERLVHLPGCYQVNDSKRTISSTTPTRRSCNLPDEGLVFCSFNNSYKITPIMFDVWTRLLRTVPESILWLLDTSSTAKENLRREASTRGVASDRLVFAPKTSLPDHLARHRIADLFLDTFPVNAHTTASDALQMGLPIVTMAGDTMISRVAGSLLRAVGMSELITQRIEEYEQLALTLAQQPNELSRVRRKLAGNLVGNGLFDGQVFARKIEKAYEAMWAKYQSGQPPGPIVIT